MNWRLTKVKGAESKDPEGFSLAMQPQGVFTRSSFVQVAGSEDPSCATSSPSCFRTVLISHRANKSKLQALYGDGAWEELPEAIWGGRFLGILRLRAYHSGRDDSPRRYAQDDTGQETSLPAALATGRKSRAEYQQDRVETHSIPFSTDHAPEFFVQFPAAPAVFLLRGGDESSEPYVSKTTNLRRRLQRLLAPPESQSKRLNLRERVSKIEYTLTGSDFESVLLLYKILRQEFPKSYQKRLRLRQAPLVRLNLENEYPRAYVTTKLGRLGGKSLYYGPFRSRATAEKFLNDSLDLFKMRRCTFDLNPDPKFPGCVYSEMKMCLAPCFKGCTDEEYAAEVGRVQAYFDSGGQSLIAEMEAERERLSAALDFENAAHQHTRIAKVKSILFAWDELCGRLDRLDAVIVQPSAVKESKSVALFRFRQGELAGPYQLAIEADGEGEVPSLEQRVREAIEEFIPEGARSATQFSEELAILKRWYYRSHKVGELVVAKPDGSWPLRRLANAAMRVYRGEKQPADAAAETRT